MAILLAVSPVCPGAVTTSQQIAQNYQEMRKNLAWLTLGLNDLGRGNDSKLKLTADQRKKILPVFETLVGNNLVLLTAPPKRQHENQSQNRRQYDPNDPMAQARMRKQKEQTDFGNKQADLIDAVLTPAQRSYIDNLNFNAEKYGFIDFRKLFGNGGPGQQRPDQKVIDDMRTKMRAGQEALIKLNNEVLKMLKS